MDIIRNLHNECRRYCMYHSSFWLKEYFYLFNRVEYRDYKTKMYAEYELEALNNALAREKILSSILKEIEKTILEDFKTTEELKKYIMYSYENAHIDVDKYCMDSYSFEKEEIMYRAIEDEKKEFKDFIISLNEKRLKYAEPLFYRRVLGMEEGNRIKNCLLEARRKFRKAENDSLFGDYFFIDKKVPPQILRNIFVSHGIKKLYEIDTSREAYLEIDVSIFNPYGKISREDTSIFNPYEKINREKIFSSNAMDWVFYADHEDYVRIDGKWLINDIISEIPEMQNMLNEYIYK
ncbi:hypothetical protein [Clostridium sp. Marseille-QA1073]